VSKRVAAVVLAAGMSRRMGRPKALLPLGGLPMIVRVIEPLISIGSIHPIVVVTGHQAGQVEGAMAGCDVEFVHNSEFESGGMLSSVKSGCRAIIGRCHAFFLCLGDQPLVRENTYRELLPRDMGLWPMLSASHGPEARVTMAQPTHDSKRGHPILLSSDCINEILALPDGATLKTFTQRIDTHQIVVDDPGVVTDIDTPQDYDRAILQFQAHRSEPCPSKV
jgi:molybdenum cofactor cytidylyltransferase